MLTTKANTRRKVSYRRLKSKHTSYVGLIFLCALIYALSSMTISAEILDVQVSWDPEQEPLNIGDLIHFRVTTDSPGSVVVDISTVHQSIQLYDDGSNGDAIPSDNVYELDYTIFEGDTIEEGPILVYFVKEDGAEENTGQDDEITPRITIDGTRPEVTNDGVSPDPFDPNFQVAYIRYILTESATVAINIYGSDGKLVRKLGTPSGKPGENHTTWNGINDNGDMMPDGLYTYEISAQDKAGNNAIPTRGGCILSTAYVEIDNSLIAPNPFSPDGDNVDDVTWISFDIKLIATEQQLAVLGFGGENHVTATKDDDQDISPFALLGITVFDSSGVSQAVFKHDLTAESDTDFAPNGWPNGKMPQDMPLGSGNFLGMANGYPDFSDEKKDNDWDSLMPFHGPYGDGSLYTTSFSVGWDAEDTPDGTYLISIECELVGRTFEFVDYMKTESGIVLGEKWHAKPVHHNGVTAFARRKSVIIDRKEIIPVDDDPPIVTSTNPSSGSVVDPTREKVTEIVASLDDGADGSGVDPIKTSIHLLDPLGNKLGGQIVPYGLNVVKLVLESELTISGQYTIQVISVDKRGNKASQSSDHLFTIADKSAPVVVPNTIQPIPNDIDSEGNPIAPYTQPINEISVVLSDGVTGSGVDLENSTIYLRDSQNETVAGEVNADADNEKLMYILENPLTTSGAYTIVVIATDNEGAKGVYTYQIYLDMAENIVVRFDGNTHLTIYAGTEVLGNPEGSIEQLKQIAVRKTVEFPFMVSELSRIEDNAIEFQPFDIALTQEAELTMYYEDEQLPLGIEEQQLSIYAFKSQAKDWVQVPNVALSEKDNKLTASINHIDQYYTIAYASPVAPSMEEKVILNPPKYFNPDRELMTFTFARNMDNHKIEIYNTAGDRIIVLKEQERADKTLGWDGRNEEGKMIRNGIFICIIAYSIEGRMKTFNRLIAVVK